MFNNVYNGKTVLVTGHTGFKGSWLSIWLNMMGAKVVGYSLDPYSERGNFEACHLHDRLLADIRGDTRDYEKLNQTIKQYRPEIIFHLAAQALVRKAYAHPKETYETNLMGSLNIMEAVRENDCVKTVVMITSDKCYENVEQIWGYKETDRMGGYDPYSSSKGCTELMISSYRNSYFNPKDYAKHGKAVASVRAGNVIGGGDFARDRIIPDCVRAAQAGEPVIVRNPYSTRPYQHVLEPVIAYLMIAQRQYENPGLAGWYNVGPDDCDCVTTGDLVDIFCRTWGEGMTWENRAEVNAPHEAGFLKLDCSKLKSTFGWRPRWNIQEAVERTVEWTKAWLTKKSIPEMMDGQIRAFLQEEYHGKVEQ